MGGMNSIWRTTDETSSDSNYRRARRRAGRAWIFYYQRTTEDITIRIPKIEIKP
jgi:hypothetical protein